MSKTSKVKSPDTKRDKPLPTPRRTMPLKETTPTYVGIDFFRGHALVMLDGFRDVKIKLTKAQCKAGSEYITGILKNGGYIK